MSKQLVFSTVCTQDTFLYWKASCQAFQNKDAIMQIHRNPNSSDKKSENLFVMDYTVCLGRHKISIIGTIVSF